MRKIRVLYKKVGRSVYISHLDIMRTFQRAFKRADIDVKHTEGFNPHPYISIALPLSLGYSGECELLDIVLQSGETEKELVEKLNFALPEGVEAVCAYENGRPVREIAFSEFFMILDYDDGVPDKACEKIKSIFNMQEIVVLKRSKRGEKETDIAPMIKSIDVSELDGTLAIRTVLSSGASMLNPEYLIKAIEKYAPLLTPSFFEIAHTNIFDAEMKKFR